MATTSRDPRTIVTPDAFSVDPPLLGTPLAQPWRRGVAVLIDVLLVALITALTSGFWFILGVVAAAFFFTRAKKQRKTDRGSNVFRFFLGCMGVMALALTAVVFFGIRFVNQATDDFGSDFSIEDLAEDPLRGGSAAGGLRTIIGGIQEGTRLSSTNDPDEAVALAVSVGLRLQELDAADEVEETLREIIPEVVGDVDGDEILARAMDLLASARFDEPADTGPTADLPGDQAGMEAREARDARLAEALEVAGDTIGELEQDLARANRNLENARAELDEALQRRGLVGWFTSRIDSLGFGFGWWTLYFAILMPWMKGQTPGKRAMGLRVVRLDGHPITGWHAFERAGGYAAGVATGTLGFLQIYWDANRQAIHDKVAGTVVIRDGVPKVPGYWDRQVNGGAAHADEPGSGPS